MVKPLGIAIIISTVLGVSLVAPSETVHLYTLIHWPSVVLVLGITVGILMVWQPSARWRRFLAYAGGLSYEADRPTIVSRQALTAFLTAASRSALMAGLAGELLGIIMILTAARNPAAIEPGITLAAISLLYGFGLSELVFQRLRKRTAADTVDVLTDIATSEQAAGQKRPQSVVGAHHALHEANVS